MFLCLFFQAQKLRENFNSYQEIVVSISGNKTAQSQPLTSPKFLRLRTEQFSRNINYFCNKHKKIML